MSNRLVGLALSGCMALAGCASPSDPAALSAAVSLPLPYDGPALSGAWAGEANCGERRVHLALRIPENAPGPDAMQAYAEFYYPATNRNPAREPVVAAVELTPRADDLLEVRAIASPAKLTDVDARARKALHFLVKPREGESIEATLRGDRDCSLTLTRFSADPFTTELMPGVTDAWYSTQRRYFSRGNTNTRDGWMVAQEKIAAADGVEFCGDEFVETMPLGVAPLSSIPGADDRSYHVLACHGPGCWATQYQTFAVPKQGQPQESSPHHWTYADETSEFAVINWGMDRRYIRLFTPADIALKGTVRVYSYRGRVLGNYGGC